MFIVLHCIRSDPWKHCALDRFEAIAGSTAPETLAGRVWIVLCRAFTARDARYKLLTLNEKLNST